jgi:hypothetical protein
MNIFEQFQGVQAGGAASIGMSRGGSLASLQGFEELQKALTASNYETDVSQLTGGGALTAQSLDRIMKATVQENKHFAFFNRLQSTNATNIVDEYVRQNSVGGVFGGSFSTQMAQVRSATGEYSREIGRVKFQMQLRQVGLVQNIGGNIQDSIGLEEANGAKSILTDCEYSLFHGNADASPTQFDGIFKQIDDEIAAGKMNPESVYDMDGKKLNAIEPFSAIASTVSDLGSWGSSTDVFLTNSVQADLNLGLDPAFRWTAEGQNTPMIGGHVGAIRLQDGPLKTTLDTFLHAENHPMVVPWDGSSNAQYTSMAASNIAIKPASLTVDASASDSASRFTTSRAGNYYWAVAAIDFEGKGFSAVTKSSQTLVAGGKKAVLTITKSSSGTESGYAIYRSRQDGTNASSDMRLVKVIAKTGDTTTFTDLNRDLPGSISVPVLNMNPSSDALGWRQYYGMTKIPLPFGVGLQPQYSWFQFLFGYLRVTKPRHHGYIKNIVSSKAVWRPHTGE